MATQVTSSNEKTITKLRDEYGEGSLYEDRSYSYHSDGAIVSKGFIGSKEAVFLSSTDSIVHKAPACIAAPIITMVAKNKIELGIDKQSDPSLPVRLFASEKLSITTNHLLVGDIMIVKDIPSGSISCKKLTLLKSAENIFSDYFDTIRSWIVTPDVQVEILSQTKR